jgi:alpha-1,4-digalacturonate transport system permease protein
MNAHLRDTAEYRWLGSPAIAFLLRRRGGRYWAIADVVTYTFLFLGTLLLFVPVLWIVLSSFKSPDKLNEASPTLLPYQNATVTVPGYDKPLPLVDAVFDDGSVQRLAQVGRIGIQVTLIDPSRPGMKPINVNVRNIIPVQIINFALDNYTDAVSRFPFLTYLRNSVVVTVAATALTLWINSMAAFALSKYRFPGRNTLLIIILSALMLPLSVSLIPVFLVIVKVGWFGNLLGVIIPPAAAPTGVFLLRQYMLTIPDELLEAARIDGASEWRIYWQVVLPLAKPALAVLAIFSIMWRWNDFLWPLVVLGGRSELSTLQVGLNSFQGELNVQWNLILSMTVLTLVPITLIFMFLQRYLTTGIATTGMKG